MSSHAGIWVDGLADALCQVGLPEDIIPADKLQQIGKILADAASVQTEYSGYYERHLSSAAQPESEAGRIQHAMEQGRTFGERGLSISNVSAPSYSEGTLEWLAFRHGFQEGRTAYRSGHGIYWPEPGFYRGKL